MQKAGGTIGIIAGIFGVLAAMFTILVGGLAGAFNAEDASTVVWLGRGGVLFSFLCIIFGAISMNAKSKMPGNNLIICSIAGALFGGTLVAVFMVLALMGGIINSIGSRKTVAS